MEGRREKIERLEELLAGWRDGDPVELAQVRHQLAHAYRADQRFEEALALFEENVAVCRRVFGDDHQVTLRRRSSLANCHYAAGRYGEAIALFEGILRDRERALGLDHPDTARSRGSLANSYREAGLPSPRNGLSGR